MTRHPRRRLSFARPPALLLACGLTLGLPAPVISALQDAAPPRDTASDAEASADDGGHAVRVLPKGEQHALDNVTFELGGMPVRVLSLTESDTAADDEVTVEFLEQPGSSAVVRRDQLPREVRYRIEEARVAPDTREQWVHLADVAAELKLRLREYEALRSARRVADASDEDDADTAADAELDERIDAARETVAALRVDRARELRADDQLIQALHVLEDTASRFEPADSARRAGELHARWLPESDAATKPDTAERGDEAADEQAADTGADGERTLPDDDALRPAADRLAEGREQLQRARVVGAEDTGEQRELLNGALAALRDAQAKLGGAADLASDGSEDSDDTERDSPRARLLRTTRALLVHTHVELGHLELQLDDSRAAYQHASLAAAIDPEDPAVSDLRTAIAAHDAG